MVGFAIKKYLKDSGRSQAYLSKRTGIPQNTLNAMLNEKRNISINEYWNICKALGVSLEMFQESIKEETQQAS